MSKFVYPKLPRHEIVATLRQFNIAEQVSEDDLNRRDSEFICSLYARILSRIESDQEGFDQGQMEFEALAQLENPEHHANSIPMMDLYRKTQHTLSAIRCPKAFTLKDLVKPEPDRTLHFLGVLLNFFLYREQKLDLFDPFNDDIELLEERKSAMEAKISELEQDIKEIDESRESQSSLVQDIKFEIQKLQQAISELNKHQATLKTLINKAKEKAKEINEKISDADFALHQTAQENARLHSKIVQSPDKLQSALEEKKSVQVETKNAERAAMQSFQEKSSTLEAYAKACKKMNKHFTQLNAIQEQANSVKSVEKEVKLFKNKIGDEGVIIKSHEVKLTELQTKADQLRDSKKQLEREIAANNEAATKELNNVKSEAESKRHELEVRDEQLQSILAEVDAIASKKTVVRGEGEAKIKELCSKAEKIMAEFYNYSKRVSGLLPVNEEALQERM